MTDNELLLELLRDGKAHLVSDIELVAQLRKGRRMTVHSRVADLRKKGWDIRAFRHMRQPGYRLLGYMGEAVKVPKPVPVVQGYVFTAVNSMHDLWDRNDTICTIVARAPTAGSIGAAFYVRFGDGHEDVVYGSELNPWYPT